MTRLVGTSYIFENGRVFLKLEFEFDYIFNESCMSTNGKNVIWPRRVTETGYEYIENPSENEIRYYQEQIDNYCNLPLTNSDEDVKLF